MPELHGVGMTEYFPLEPGMSFGLYMVGFIVLVIGLGIGAFLLQVPAQWIAVGVVCAIGLGILMGVTSTKQKDPS